MRWVDGTEIRRNDACPCGSGRKVKRCCIKLLRDIERPLLVDFLPDMATYVSATDLWPEPVDEEGVLAFFREFDGVDVAQTLSKFGVILQGRVHDRANDAEVTLLKLTLPPEWFRKVALWLQSGRRHTALPRLLLLAAIRLSMIHSGGASPRRVVQGNEHRLGTTLLGLASFLEPDTVALLGDAVTTSEKRGVLAASFYRNAFYEYAENYGTDFGRHWALIMRAPEAVEKRYPREVYDFNGRYEQLLGYSTTLKMAIVLAAHRYYQRPPSEIISNPQRFLLGEGYLSTLPEAVRPQAYSALRSLAMTWPEHVAKMRAGDGGANNKLQFLSIYGRPFVETEGAGFFPLDTEFLGRQNTEGIYWELFAALKAARSESEIVQLRIHFGRCVEWYVAEILRSQAGGPRTTWLDWDGGFQVAKQSSVPDGAIFQDGVLYLIEVTTSSVTPSAAVSGDPVTLRTALERLWFEGHGDRVGKLIQLQNAVNSFAKGSLKLKGLDRGSVRRVIPIVVTLRSLPQFQILSNWYWEIMQDNGLSESFVRSLTFMDLRDLEAVSSGEQGIDWRVVERKVDAARATSTSNLMIFGLGVTEMRRHPRVDAWLGEAFEAVDRCLAGK